MLNVEQDLLMLEGKPRGLVRLLTTTRGIYLATLVLLCLLLVLSIYRAYPFVDNVSAANSNGDDWLIYKLNAQSILHDGLTMPALQRSYHLPGGFLYNYFIAAVFALCGENSTCVYLVQAVMLALSVGLAALAFRPYLTQKTAAIYFAALALVAFADVFVFYTFRLLSENLVLFLLPIFYFLTLRTFKRRSIFLACSAGAALGLCVLCRQNLILLGPAIAALLFMYLKRQSGRALLSLVFLASFGLTFSLLPLRNYAVTGTFSIPVIQSTAQWLATNLEVNASPTSPVQQALRALTYYARRILFCAGLTTFLGLPFYWLKPHWTVIWTGALIYICRLWRSGSLEFSDAFALTFILTYVGPLIAISDISNYGVRMIVPVMPMVLFLAVSSFNRHMSSCGSGHSG